MPVKLRHRSIQKFNYIDSATLHNNWSSQPTKLQIFYLFGKDEIWRYGEFVISGTGYFTYTYHRFGVSSIFTGTFPPN